MIEYLNHNNNQVSVLGQDKMIITFSRGEHKILSDYFKKYVPRYLKIVKVIPESHKTFQLVRKEISPNKPINRPIIKPAHVNYNPVKIRPEQAKTVQIMHHVPSKIVGKTRLILSEAEAFYRKYLVDVQHSISNDVGVGILSFNRLESLDRLIRTIRQHTDLRRTTVFVSDESTDQQVKDYIRKIPDMVIIDNNVRLGVAGNTNRLMRCLKRFKYKYILNDDVEILKTGWDTFYPGVMNATGYHHFCMQQMGLLGSVNRGRKDTVNGHNIYTIDEKPHGAVIAYDCSAENKIGFMDESFGFYGMEHVDWSHRISLSGIQPSGYHDVSNSETYFKINQERSVTPERLENLSAAKKLFSTKSQDKSRIFVDASPNTLLPAISYIIPFRDMNRLGAIRTVLQNVKAQKFPIIDIIMVEQDVSQKAQMIELESVKYLLVPSPSPAHLFMKSTSFNKGFALAKADKIIFHDADMIVRNEYTKVMYDLLKINNGVHIGANVLYLDAESTNKIVNSREVDPKYKLTQTVGYFVGGSLGCNSKTYINIGGFNEDFVGYGNEDCDFFDRLASAPNFYNNRSENLIHLFHGRVANWKDHHNRNKEIEANLKKNSMNIRTSTLNKILLEKYKLDISNRWL